MRMIAGFTDCLVLQSILFSVTHIERKRKVEQRLFHIDKKSLFYPNHGMPHSFTPTGSSRRISTRSIQPWPRSCPCGTRLCSSRSSRVPSIAIIVVVESRKLKVIDCDEFRDRIEAIDLLTFHTVCKQHMDTAREQLAKR